MDKIRSVAIKKILFCVFPLALIILSTNSDVMCGELRDYSLPSERQQLQRPAQQLQRPAKHYQEYRMQKVYDKFRERMAEADLTGDERTELIKKYRTKCDSAKDRAEALYYFNLIEILKEPQQGKE